MNVYLICSAIIVVTVVQLFRKRILHAKKRRVNAIDRCNEIITLFSLKTGCASLGLYDEAIQLIMEHDLIPKEVGLYDFRTLHKMAVESLKLRCGWIKSAESDLEREIKDVVGRRKTEMLHLLSQNRTLYQEFTLKLQVLENRDLSRLRLPSIEQLPTVVPSETFRLIIAKS